MLRTDVSIERMDGIDHAADLRLSESLVNRQSEERLRNAFRDRIDIPDKTREVNYEGALTVFEAARDAGVSEFVNAVTCSVYGRTEEETDETFDCEPESPYSEAKLEAEQEMFERYDGEMALTGLRLGTVYG